VKLLAKLVRDLAAFVQRLDYSANSACVTLMEPVCGHVRLSARFTRRIRFKTFLG
jgi:hypothetical protein